MKSKKSIGIKRYAMPVAIVLVVVAVVAGVNIYFAPYQTTTTGNVEQSVGVQNNQGQTSDLSAPRPKLLTIQEKQSQFSKAPELQGIVGYINTDDGITLQKLRDGGKVVLVDFWTYSCINCQRTIPYLNAWYEKYKDQGLVIVGVHSPEFGFEKDYNNVLDAVERFGIKYPVVQDNDFATWKAYKNNFWPRKYLIDVDGFVRFDHIGEGAYDATELVIQDLLAERAHRLNITMEMNKSLAQPGGAVGVDFNQVRTPEIYFGYRFARSPLGNSESFVTEQSHYYALPPSDAWRSNIAYLGGEWYSHTEYVELRGVEGVVGLKYSARNVNIVADGNGTISVRVDGKGVSDSDAGNDIVGGVANVDGSRLYSLVISESYGAHEIEMRVSGDVRIYTFTFG